VNRLFLPLFLLLLASLLPSKTTTLTVADFEAAILKQTNLQRAKYQLPALLPNAELSDLARRHARNMARQKFFAHQDKEGMQVSDRQRKYYPQLMVQCIGENLAYNQHSRRVFSPTEIVQGWMDSPDHRENILSPDYSHLGVGVVLIADELYSVQNFAYPVVKMLSQPLKRYSRNKSYLFQFQYLAVQPKHDFAAYLILPKKDTRVMLTSNTYALGVKPLQIEWIGGNTFKLKLPFEYGKGQYRLAFGWGGAYSESDFTFKVR